MGGGECNDLAIWAPLLPQPLQSLSLQSISKFNTKRQEAVPKVMNFEPLKSRQVWFKHTAPLVQRGHQLYCAVIEEAKIIFQGVIYQKGKEKENATESTPLGSRSSESKAESEWLSFAKDRLHLKRKDRDRGPCCSLIYHPAVTAVTRPARFLVTWDPQTSTFLICQPTCRTFAIAAILSFTQLAPIHDWFLRAVFAAGQSLCICTW